jgi:hypothetical protein
VSEATSSRRPAVRSGIVRRVAARGSYLARSVVREGTIAVRITRTHIRNRLRYRAVANPYAVLWINPNAVCQKLAMGWRLRKEAPGTILEGDWDLPVTMITDSDKFRGVVERFSFGVDWEDTSLFRNRFSVQLKRTGEVGGMRSIEDLANYYREHVDRLYRIIETDGFQPPSIRRRIAPAYVYIGRSGEIIWGPGGNHRLAIAHVLQLETIPVIAHVRHTTWQRARETVAADSSSGISVEQHNHPDLQDLRRRKGGARP